MPGLAQSCDTCAAAINAQFGPGGARTTEVIAGDLVVTDQCFVRDTIHFLNSGRLIFAPDRQGNYLREYYVICRKLIVTGGARPPRVDPCGPDDPGGAYDRNNVITWRDRLQSAAAGNPPAPLGAANGASHDRNTWTDQGQGNNGADGGRGNDGAGGNAGGNGRGAPTFTLIAAEVDIGLSDHLIIDFDGQEGGRGARGQNGGDGGDGMGGRNATIDSSWPGGDFCSSEAGRGGDGGDGGDGGTGGNGGNGGNAGQIFIVSTNVNLTTGPLFSGRVTYVNDGGNGGVGGFGGIGGRGGRAGRGGNRNRECDVEAADGDPGQHGEPQGVPTGLGDPNNRGGPGAHGSGATVTPEALRAGTCADAIPLPIQFTTLTPATYCRGTGGIFGQDGTIAGSNLGQVTQVTASQPGVTITIKPTSTDTQLDLRLDVGSGATLGVGNLTLSRPFGAQRVVNNAITIQAYDVTGVAPASGARGTSVPVVISGHCFDPTAGIQQVNVTGLGVNVSNIFVVDQQTIQATFDIGPAAPASSRDVTVRTGANQFTRANAFTVTP